MSRRPTVVTTDGRWLWCGRIEQESVYAGLLEGLPTREMNQRLLDRLEARLVKEHTRRGFLLIEPEQKPIDYDGRYPFGTPAALPSIQVKAWLRSPGSAKDGDPNYGSSLVVVWFQDEFAFPIDEKVHEQLVALDWAKLAVDSEI